MKFDKTRDKWRNSAQEEELDEDFEDMEDAEPAPKRSVGSVITAIFKWIYRLRGILLAIPVGWLAIRLALENIARLPETVGINLLANGEYAMYVTRSVAVMGPLAVTAVCLLLMFCSRRVLYPWLISLFSLVLPLLIWVTNIFPA